MPPTIILVRHSQALHNSTNKSLYSLLMEFSTDHLYRTTVFMILY